MNDNKTDLTVYGDGELSLHVFNDEGLYNMRHDRHLIDTLNDFYIYDAAQLAELEQDLEDDLNETQGDDTNEKINS